MNIALARAAGCGDEGGLTSHAVNVASSELHLVAPSAPHALRSRAAGPGSCGGWGSAARARLNRNGRVDA